MKRLLCILSLVLILTSCSGPPPAQTSTIVGNPVVLQINISGNDKFKYEVYFKVADNTNARMLTNFRYQVGDTLISYYEFYEVKLIGLKDSLASSKKQIEDMHAENQKLKTNVDILLTKQNGR